MKRFLFAVLVLVVLTGARATFGQDFNAAALPQLQVNTTTLPQAVALLGADPSASTVGASGATAYTWQYVQAKASMWTGKSSAENKRVVLVFNTDGTFQRILQLQGITLDPPTHARLMTEPAAALAKN